MHQNKNTATVTHKLKITDGETYQVMEGKLEKCTYSLERGKEGLSGHREIRTIKDHKLSREHRVKTYQNITQRRKQTCKQHLPTGVGSHQDWSGHRKKVR
jgi:hypothetical protein